MTDPYRKPVAGQPFVPSARQTSLFIETAQALQKQQTERPRLAGEDDAGVVLVRNDTGGDLTDEHAVVGLDPPLIVPDDRVNVVFERPVFAGIAPSAGQPFAILLQPLADGAIGKAVISGGAWVRVEVGTAGDDYADAIDSESARLLTGGAGSARVLWLGDDEELDPDVRWAYVRLGDSKPVLFKAAIGVNPLIDTGGAVAADLQQFNSVGGVWEDDPLLPEIQVWPGGGFIGVAFPDQLVDVYFSLQSNRWQAINGGSVVVSATSEFDIGIADSGITATVGVTEITIDRVIIPVPAGKVFRALWSPYEEDGVWIAIGRLTLGCGLEYDLDPAAAGILNLDGAGIAGDGLEWDDENCLLSTEPIACSDLAAEVPCCSTICSRLDEIEDRLDIIDQILIDLIACCEYNTACCEENRQCCEYNTACCEENRQCCEYNTYCCEYLDARVDYCCGYGAPSPGTPGGGPDCGRCVWEWDGVSDPVLVESCSGDPVTCGCDPPTNFTGEGIYFTDCYDQTISVCDCVGVPATLSVVVSLDACASQNESFEANLVSPELGVFWRGTDSQGRQWDFFCTPETTDWIIEVSCSPPTVDHQFTNVISASCDPFEVVFEEPASTSVAFVPCFDCSTGTATITVSG